MSEIDWCISECATVCQFVLDHNKNIPQQIIENRTDLLELVSIEDLIETDDLGINAVFLSVYYGRPAMLKYLKKRGLDVVSPCDPGLFGTPLFYAVRFNRPDIIEALCDLGVDLDGPCNSFGETAMDNARRLDNVSLCQQLEELKRRQWIVTTRLQSTVRMFIYRKRYKRRKQQIISIQRVTRGFLLRRTLYEEDDDESSNSN